MKEEIENFNMEEEMVTKSTKDGQMHNPNKLDARLLEFHDDTLYNLRRLAEITLAYFNYQDNRKGSTKVKLFEVHT